MYVLVAVRVVDVLQIGLDVERTVMECESICQFGDEFVILNNYRRIEYLLSRLSRTQVVTKLSV